MDWVSCQNIFNSISQESQQKQIRFASPCTQAVGDFFRQVSYVPEDRKALYWKNQGGIVQKWAQDELFGLGYTDQRFKFKKNGSYTDVEFTVQNLTSGTPIETLGKDSVEAVLQAFYIALKD
jgi:hypothetical protein